VNFEDITLEKSVLQDGSDQAAREWVQKQVDVNAGTGSLPSEYMRDVDIVRYDRTGNEMRRWTRASGGDKISLQTENGSRSPETEFNLIVRFKNEIVEVF